MTKLRDRMMGELQLRNYSEHTIYSYIGAVERFARHFGKSPTELGADHVKQFLLFLKNEKKVVWQTVQANRCAIQTEVSTRTIMRYAVAERRRSSAGCRRAPRAVCWPLVRLVLQDPL